MTPAICFCYIVFFLSNNHTRGYYAIENKIKYLDINSKHLNSYNFWLKYSHFLPIEIIAIWRCLQRRPTKPRKKSLLFRYMGWAVVVNHTIPINLCALGDGRWPLIGVIIYRFLLIFMRNFVYYWKVPWLNDNSFRRAKATKQRRRHLYYRVA